MAVTTVHLMRHGEVFNPDKILYVRSTTVHINHGSGKRERSTSVLEEWHRGRETHRLVRATEPDGSEIALDHVISAAGVMQQINEEGEYRVFRPTDNADAEHVIAAEQAGFLADFQKQLGRATLDPSPGLEVDGRPALRYRAAGEVKPGEPPGPERTLLVDRETGEPLRYSTVMTFRGKRMSEAQIPASTTGTANIPKITDSDTLAARRKPPSIGPMTAPILPTPMAQPIPVPRASGG